MAMYSNDLLNKVRQQRKPNNYPYVTFFSNQFCSAGGLHRGVVEDATITGGVSLILRFTRRPDAQVGITSERGSPDVDTIKSYNDISRSPLGYSHRKAIQALFMLNCSKLSVEAMGES
jgi:hypothetical protein